MQQLVVFNHKCYGYIQHDFLKIITKHKCNSI
jgi:hypothetical protein